MLNVYRSIFRRGFDELRHVKSALTPPAFCRGLKPLISHHDPPRRTSIRNQKTENGIHRTGSIPAPCLSKKTKMDSAPPQTDTDATPRSVDELPPEAIALASRFFDAARSGQMNIFEQALPKGLPANMTNDKGDTLVSTASTGWFWLGVMVSSPYLSVWRQRQWK